MKNSTKLTAIFMVICLLTLTFTSCGQQNGASNDNTASTTSVPEVYSNKEVSSTLSMADEVKAFYEKVDTKYGYDLTEELAYNWDRLSDFLGWRSAGSDAEHICADYIEEEFKKIGLQNVEKIGTKCDKFQFNNSSLKIKDTDILFAGEDVEAGTNGPASYQVSGTDGDLNAEIVDVKEGYEWQYTKNVKGKIVLIHVDQWNVSWIDGYITQAKQKGAIAAITWSDSGYGEEGTFTTNVQDACLPDIMPVVAISADQAKKIKQAIKSGHNKCTLNVDAKLSLNNGTTYNVVGMIPGENHDQRIIISGHYDKYWYGFQDDCAAIGLVATIAKAMVESGYKPKNDIYFIAHGAEEWGVADCMFDWTTGAWGMCNEAPDFATKTIAMLNCELPAFKNDENMNIMSVPEFYTLTDKMYTSGLMVTSGDRKFSTTKVASTTMEDGISYREYGVPYFVNGFENDSFINKKYHTIADNKDTYDEDTFKTNINWYGAFAMYIDAEPALELDMTNTVDELRTNFNKKLAKEAGVDTEKYLTALDNLSKAAEARNAKIAECNANYEEAVKNGDDQAIATERENGLKLNEESLATFQMIQDDLLKVTDSYCFYGHRQMYDNIKCIDAVLKGIDKGQKVWAKDGESGIGDNAWQINFGLDGAFGYFSLELGRKSLYFYNDNYYSDKNHEQWGYKHLMPMLDTGVGSYAIQHCEESIDEIKDIDAVKDCYQSARKDALKIIKTYATKEIADIANISEALN